MRKLVLLTVVCAIFFAGCTAPDVLLKPNAENIQIGRNHPGNDYLEIRTISVTHGNVLLTRRGPGTYEGACMLLKNKALSLGADYVQITKCYDFIDGEYTIAGIAYKRKK